MGTTTKTLYDTDFVEWTTRMGQLLRERRFEELDHDNLAEEVEDLGKCDRSAVRSQLHRMLLHLIKQKIQPERSGGSWRASIVGGQREIQIKLEDSPSLRHHLQESLRKIYRGALRDALQETGLANRAKDLGVPAECPYTLDELLDGDLDTLQRPI